VDAFIALHEAALETAERGRTLREFPAFEPVEQALDHLEVSLSSIGAMSKVLDTAMQLAPLKASAHCTCRMHMTAMVSYTRH
jgi:hypothetical protein